MDHDEEEEVNAAVAGGGDAWRDARRGGEFNMDGQDEEDGGAGEGVAVGGLWINRGQGTGNGGNVITGLTSPRSWLVKLAGQEP